MRRSLDLAGQYQKRTRGPRPSRPGYTWQAVSRPLMSRRSHEPYGLRDAEGNTGGPGALVRERLIKARRARTVWSAAGVTGARLSAIDQPAVLTCRSARQRRAKSRR